MTTAVDSVMDTVIAPNEELQRQLREEANNETRDDTPKMYRVTLLNDHSTLPTFVIEVLRDVFNVNEREAANIMMTAHRSGSATVRVYTKEVADMRLAQAEAVIQERGVNARNPREACELKFDVQPEEK